MIPAPRVGSVLASRYELVGHIARGGMGDVYEAEDRQLRRRVAVKVFRAAPAGADRARFDAEVVTLAALNHPGLVRVYDAGEQAGEAFVVLDFIEGPTLAARLAEQGPLPPSEVAALGAQVADALAYVHSRGVVHRDVTPSNVLCGPDGRPRLADFGIARLVDTTRITAPATALGTAAYMAPEQVQGHDVTPAADVYSLGLVLLELLTGRTAFSGSPQEAAIGRLARSPDTATGVPGAWRDLLRGMTDRAAQNRPSATEVRDRLRAMLAGATEPTGTVPAATQVAVAAPNGSVAAPSDAATRALPPVDGTSVMPAALVPEQAPAPRGRRRAVLAAIIGLVLLIAGLVAGSGRGLDLETPPATTTEPAVSSSTTTTAAPTTTEAPAQKRGKPDGSGNGKGAGRS